MPLSLQFLLKLLYDHRYVIEDEILEVVVVVGGALVVYDLELFPLQVVHLEPTARLLYQSYQSQHEERHNQGFYELAVLSTCFVVLFDI
jgi:hypothetical protein